MPKHRVYLEVLVISRQLLDYLFTYIKAHSTLDIYSQWRNALLSSMKNDTFHLLVFDRSVMSGLWSLEDVV